MLESGHGDALREGPSRAGTLRTRILDQISAPVEDGSESLLGRAGGQRSVGVADDLALAGDLLSSHRKPGRPDFCRRNASAVDLSRGINAARLLHSPASACASPSDPMASQSEACPASCMEESESPLSAFLRGIVMEGSG
jgi:hypothetical protein